MKRNSKFVTLIILIVVLILIIYSAIAYKKNNGTPNTTSLQTTTPTIVPYAQTDSTTYLTTISQPDYILNTNTMKFYYPDCANADRIKPSNRIEYTGNRDTPISLVYSPCQRCNP